MAQNAPGKHYRKGLSLRELTKRFPDDATAEQWFIDQRWPDGVHCPYCGSDNVQTGATHKSMPFRCRAKTCGKRFSAKTGTVMQSSNVGFQTWVFAMYLLTTNLKGISSMKLHRELDITQKSAWHLAHRLRDSFTSGGERMAGPVEVDEAYFGGRNANKHSHKKIKNANGTIGKTAVVGVKDRSTNAVKASVVERTNQETLQGFVNARKEDGAKVYTDEHGGYIGLENHEVVKHSAGEYVKEQAHTNGIESFWSMLKRGYMGTYHQMSVKHLDRYANEFAGRHNTRPLDTIDQMTAIAQGLVGKHLRYQDLIQG